MDVEINAKGHNNSRICTLKLNSKKLLTPAYFPSITSAETRTDVSELVEALTTAGYPTMLISCYDLYNKKITDIDKINKYSENGGIILLDSGEFENFHFNHIDWTFINYEQMSKKINSDFFTSFDKTPLSQTTDVEIEEFTKEFFPKSLSLTTNSECILVCHGNFQTSLVELIKEMCSKFKVSMIAIPERELGNSFSEYCQTVSKIRELLNAIDEKIIIHILGCGNPVSISALAYAGADTFDAVDWCRWGIDPRTAEYGNSLHVKLFDCTCVYCGSSTLSQKRQAWFHNLDFYKYFLARLRQSIMRGDSLAHFLETENIDQHVISNLSKLF